LITVNVIIGIEYGEKTINEKSIVLMGHSMGALSASAAAATYLCDDIHSQNNENINVMINENAVKRKNITLVLVSPAFSFTKDQRNQSVANHSSLISIPTTSTPDNRSVTILEKIATSVKRPLNPKPVAPKSLFKDMFTFFKDFFQALAKLPVKIILRR
jgi:pimeloyl-ACP methyl ester carboxylesterase